MGRGPGANDMHALYGAGYVATRQDILILTTVDVKTGSGVDSCCFYRQPGRHVTVSLSALARRGVKVTGG